MPAKSERLTYRDAGVDIDAGNEVVERIRTAVQKTHGPQVLPESHGAFGGFFRLFPKGLFAESFKDPVLVGATDGVGTKLKIAFDTGRFDTVGIDLVAMCVNDLIVGGARPLFFLDYIGTGIVEPETLEAVVEGIAEGCLQSRCALLGGETAELPGFYKKGEFDLAGFSVGLVERSRIIDGKKVKAGDYLIGLPSSGLHSNGFSLVRKALLDGRGKRALKANVAELGKTLGEELLTPTRIYVQAILAVLEKYPAKRPIRAMAHITGGGLVENVPRVLPEDCDAVFERRSWDVPPIFDMVAKAGNVERAEMDRVFNQGLGMVLVVAPKFVDKIVALLDEEGYSPKVVGEIRAGAQRVKIR